jgi:hypothetical protein
VEIDQWLTVAAIVVTLVVGMSQAAATIWAAKSKDEAQTIFKGAFATALFIIQAGLGVGSVAFATTGRFNLALACLSVNAVIFFVEFLMSRQPIQRSEVVQLVLYGVGISALTLAGFMMRIVDVLQLMHKG